MLINIGEDTVLRDRDIVALVDLTRPTTEDLTVFLDTAEREGQLRRLGAESPRTALIAQAGTRCQVVYLTSVTTETLIRRVPYRHLFGG
jgi:hypothetical protein